MRPAVVRLLVIAALFVLWIGYLAYLWLFTLHYRPVPPGFPDAVREPLVLSRPQFQAAPLVVVAHIDAVAGEGLWAFFPPLVRVEEVLKDDKKEVNKGDVLAVAGLAESRRREPDARKPKPPPDFIGPGSYLLPLSPRDEGSYEVTPVPQSPGFHPTGGLRRLYPATPEALAEFRALPR
jgi:hypothetical protein